jgi:hypothetical protein
MICKHGHDTVYCIQCKLDARGVKFYLPPERKRAVTLYDARIEFYDVYDILNREKFNGELPHVKMYLNGRIGDRTEACCRWMFERKPPKKLVSVWIELADRMPNSYAPALLHEMCHLRELIEKGKTSDTSTYFLELCRQLDAPINDVPYTTVSVESLMKIINDAKVGV